jgi:hypothetical protein
MTRVSWNVVVRKLDDRTDAGPFIWTCGITLAQRLWQAILGDVTNGIIAKGDIFHPKSGRDFLLRKTPKGGSSFPDYSQSELLDPTPAGTPDQWEKWLNDLHDLQPEPASYEELRHGLCCHLGSEEDADGFDTEQFEKPRVEPQPIAVQSKSPPSPATVDEELTEMADPEFLKSLDEAAY